MLDQSNVTVDVMDLGNRQYALVSPSRINLLSGIDEDSIREISQKEKEFTTIQMMENQGRDNDNPNITFMPTLDCNLHCQYCYSRGGDDSAYMSPQLARRAIDNLIKIRPNYEKETLSISFIGGGEPFINFTCMEDVSTYARRKFADVKIIVVSNGTFNQKQLQWLIENKAMLRISYDGLSQGNQRPFTSGEDSQEVVRNNIRELAGTDLFFTVQLTITNDSVELIPASVEHVINLGAKHIKVEAVHCSPISRGGPGLVPKVESFVKNYIAMINLLVEKKAGVKLDAVASRPTTGYYCGAAASGNVIIVPGGEITACVGIARASEKYSDVMFIGDNKSNDGFRFNKKRKNYLNKFHFSNYRKCRECNLKMICGGGCPLQSGWHNNDFFTPSQFNCQLHEQLVPKLFKMALEDKKVCEIIFDNTAQIVC